MACWTDTEALVDYLRHTFIVCDDTGMCEAVIDAPVPKEKPGGVRVPVRRAKAEGDTTDSDGSSRADDDASHLALSQSPDIHVDPGHRCRSNTAKQLEKLRQQRLAQAKTKTVAWKHTPEIPQEDLNKLFRAKTPPPRPVVPPRSLVTELIQAKPAGPPNPFQDFLQFGATMGSGNLAKRFTILVNGGSAGWVALETTVLATARVADLVGYVCWQYTERGLQPPLKEDAAGYALHMAEESGEIEADLPPLNPNDLVSRVGFPVLALVERPQVVSSPPNHFVTVYFPNGDCYTVDLESLDVPLQVVRDDVLRQRSLRRSVPEYSQNMDYNMEKFGEGDLAVPLETSVLMAGTTTFVMVRKNSSRGDLKARLSRGDVGADGAAAERPLGGEDYQSPDEFYSVEMIHKFKPNTPLQLALNNDCVELTTALDQKSPVASRLFRARSVSFKTLRLNLDLVGGVEVMEEKQGRKVFRLLHTAESGGEWRSHYLEAESAVVDRVFRRLNVALDIRQTACRRTFLARPIRKASLFKRIHSQRSSNHHPRNSQAL